MTNVSHQARFDYLCTKMDTKRQNTIPYPFRDIRGLLCREKENERERQRERERERTRKLNGPKAVARPALCASFILFRAASHAPRPDRGV